MRVKNIFISVTLACTFMSISGCGDYLDIAPESVISEKTAFKTFVNFQGYIEEAYNCIPDKLKGAIGGTTINWGDDELNNAGISGSVQFLPGVDQGSYWRWAPNRTYNTVGDIWLYKPNDDPTSDDNDLHGLWSSGWYCIRKMNLGIQNFETLQDATQEEKDLILGQLYFFRAWFHFEMAQYWGGLPYIDRAFDGNDIPQLPRLSFQEMAALAAKDFERAAELLPIDWDKTVAGLRTLGESNRLRANKIWALGYLGKCYLWAASPLAENGAQTGGTKTYAYNKELAQKSADAFGELLALVEGGKTQYKLAAFDYKSVYDHEKNGSEGSYSDIFYSVNDNFKMPGAKEAIVIGPSSDGHNSVWCHGYHWGPKVYGLVPHDKFIHMPTANIVSHYGMANGLPLEDPNSGFDKNYPFKNRDPRFYHDIMFDGFEFVNTSISSDDEKYLKYLNMSNGGWTRHPEEGSRTGYLIQKYVPHQINKYDRWDDWGKKYHCNLTYMRLSDIYLMYAEALAAVSGANASSATYPSLTAEAAINTVRARCGLANVGADYTSDPHRFMDEVRRERAVELCFEGFRWADLARWLLLTEPAYTSKTAHNFDRVESDDFYKNNDPRDARVANFTEDVVLTRYFNVKHYYFPFKQADVQLYEGFKQNPGW